YMGPYLTSWFVMVAIMMTFFLVTSGTRLGFGMWYLFAPHSEREYLLKALKPHVDGSSLWVVMVASSLFMFFPRVFRILFSGFYPVIAVIFLILIFRIIALLLRKWINSRHIESFWDVFISVGNIVPFFLIGLVAGYILSGVPLFGVGQFKVNILGYTSHYTIASGLLIAFASATISYAAIALNSDGITRIFARKWTFYSSIIMCVLIFDLFMWSFILSPYISSSLKSNPMLYIFPGTTFLASFFLPVLVWKRKFTLTYAFAALIMIGLVATFFITISPHIQVIFARTNPISPDLLKMYPNFVKNRRSIMLELIQDRKKYLPFYMFLMVAVAFLQIRMFHLHRRFTHCPLPYDEDEDELF
ncbi:cytochrome d ubiquinol oxidase subunit II, partial [Candidatus Latescibacterota bacterium]